jgi:hypothetical protein
MKRKLSPINKPELVQVESKALPVLHESVRVLRGIMESNDDDSSFAVG